MKKSTWYYPTGDVEQMRKDVAAMRRCRLTSLLFNASDATMTQRMASVLDGKGPAFFMELSLNKLYTLAFRKEAPAAVHSHSAVFRAKFQPDRRIEPLYCWSGLRDTAPFVKYLRAAVRRRPFIAGVCLDYIRYPNTVFQEDNPCDCAGCRARRMPWLGRGTLSPEDLKDPSIMHLELRTKGEAIGRIVSAVAGEMHRLGLKFSIAARTVFAGRDVEFNAPPTWGYGPAIYEGQDWPDWCRRGLLDEIHFMNYSTRLPRFERLARRHCALLAGSRVVAHEGLGVRCSAGRMTPAMLKRQMDVSRDLGLAGISLFPWQGVTEAHMRVLEKQ